MSLKEASRKVVDLAVSKHHGLALFSDGAVRGMGNSDCGQLDVGAWNDVIAVETSALHSVGSRRDGTVVVAGSFGWRQSDVDDDGRVVSWHDIRRLDEIWDDDEPVSSFGRRIRLDDLEVVTGVLGLPDPYDPAGYRAFSFTDCDEGYLRYHGRHEARGWNDHIVLTCEGGVWHARDYLETWPFTNFCDVTGDNAQEALAAFTIARFVHFRHYVSSYLDYKTGSRKVREMRRHTDAVALALLSAFQVIWGDTPRACSPASLIYFL